MRYLIPIDIEDALRVDVSTAAALGGFSFSMAAPPTPTDLGASLPYVLVERMGGTRESLVIDEHVVAVDVWDNDWADAHKTANEVLGVMFSLPETEGLSQDYLDVAVNAFPYDNPDPDHEDIPRVSFTAHVSTRAEER